jgi:hypothetical protein
LADPENRLVAGELEYRWNDALERGKDAEARLAALEHCHVPLREEQRQQLFSLGQDLRAVWHHGAAPEALKKRILRTVLHEIRINSPPHTLQSVGEIDGPMACLQITRVQLFDALEMLL